MGKPQPAIMGGAGNDTLNGTAFDDRMYGYEGNDVIHGGAGNDEIQARDGDDSLFGDGGDDTLYGGFGSDSLDGGAGNDRLFPGVGNDVLTGGTGADLFGYTPLNWTAQTEGISTITDFERGIDLIDLSRLDADESTAPGIIKGKNTPGNEAFRLVGSTDGVTAGDLTVTYGLDEFRQPITIVRGYTNTAPGADVEIHLSGTVTLTAGDFIL